VPPLARTDLDHILAHTVGLWDELRGQRLFITGGTGFFGCWLLESFAWANDKMRLKAQAVVLTRHAGLFQAKAPHLAGNPSIQLHIGDVRSFEFPDGEFSHIIHAATEPGTKLNDDNPLSMIDTIVEGTRRTLEFARNCGAQKFLLTSSGAVYGKQPSDLTHIPEDYAGAPDPMNPLSAYGEGKRLAEHLCALYARESGIDTKIARCFAFLGPYLPLRANLAIGNFIREGLDGGPIRIKGDGTPYRSYLYTVDLAIWLWTILFKGKSCSPYNVGSDEPVTIAALANLIAGQFEPRIKIEVERTPLNGLGGERYVPSIEHVRRELGLRPTIGLAEAVRRTIEWFRLGAGRLESH
jgi:nucleoside-diphosphate-sugar epimerase